MKKEEFYGESSGNSLGPLEGIKVLEATTSHAGPVAGKILADLGAEVIKIEMPEKGDILRNLGPFLPSCPEKIESSTYFQSLNRNKKGITLRLSLPLGKEVFLNLAQKVDIIIENYKPGTMERWGVGYPQVKKINPDIIYVSIAGRGQWGPQHAKPSYDAVGQATGGLMHVTGNKDDPPTRAGFGLGDDLAGWKAAFGGLSALIYRQQTRKGQHVDVSQQDAMLYAGEIGIMAAANAGYFWQRMGSGTPMASPYDSYKCQDDYVFVAIVLDAHWERFCKIIGREDLIADPRTSSIASRAQNKEFVDGIVGEWTKYKKVAEVIEILERAQLIVAPIHNFKQVAQDKHLIEREMVTEVEHPLSGPLSIYGVAPKFSITPGKVRRPAPMLGQHNHEIYQGLLDYSEEKIANLKEENVI
jgi:crotonobetainyl-CoA:carnitine CoA-transferase CaiB-like acyl-CoA transferase